MVLHPIGEHADNLNVVLCVSFLWVDSVNADTVVPRCSGVSGKLEPEHGASFGYDGFEIDRELRDRLKLRGNVLPSGPG